MASNQIACYASKQLCAIRAARLGANCNPVSGANNGFASSGIISIQASPDKETGEEFSQKDGCGRLVHYSQDQDRLKKLNLTLEFTGFDFEAIEILTGNELIMDGEGNVIGISDEGINADISNGAYLEVWTKSVLGGASCAGDSIEEGAGWFRTVFPKTILSLDDQSYENAVATVSVSGYGFSNPTLTDVGPFNDYPTAGALNPDSPRHVFLDIAGPPTLGCGYIDVPAPAGSSS